MEASAGLVAGSHNRNELIVIRRDGDPAVRTCPELWLPRNRRGMGFGSGTGVDFSFFPLFFLPSAEAAAAAEREGLPDLWR